MSESTEGAHKLNWLDKLRRRAAALLAMFAPDAAAGAYNPDRTVFIDDGVDYALPLVLPLGATEDQKAQLVQAAVREAGAAFHFQFDRPYIYAENLSLFPTANPLQEWSFQTRREVLARCHLAWERNPLAGAAVGLTTLFAVGEGMTITYRHKDVEAVLEAFRRDPENAVEEYEKSFCDALQVDGELFIQLPSQEGRTVIVSIPAWEIDYIKTEKGFIRRPVSYHQSAMQSDGTPGSAEVVDGDLAAEQVLHVAINRMPYELRGRPELFRILPWLKAYKDWLENRARQNHWRNALLWWVKLIGGTSTQVAAKRAQYKQPPPPGSLVVTNDKEEWVPLSNKVAAGDAAEDGRQIKLMAAVGVKLPEYMLGDGENANRATSKSQQLPVLRKFMDFQDILVGRVWRPIYDRVLQAAIAAGDLAETVAEQDEDGEPILDDQGEVKMIPTLEAYDVAAPALEEDDPKSLAEALQIAVTRGWASDETASAELGYDYRMELKKILRKQAQDNQAAMQGRGANGQKPPEGAPTLDDIASPVNDPGGNSNG